MKSLKSQTGFAVVEIVLAVVILALVGFVGYKVYDARKDLSITEQSTQQSDSQSTASDVKSAPAIKTVSDLDTALTILDETNPGGSNLDDSTLIEQEMSAF